MRSLCQGVLYHLELQHLLSRYLRRLSLYHLELHHHLDRYLRYRYFQHLRLQLHRTGNKWRFPVLPYGKQLLYGKHLGLNLQHPTLQHLNQRHLINHQPHLKQKFVNMTAIALGRRPPY